MHRARINAKKKNKRNNNITKIMVVQRKQNEIN